MTSNFNDEICALLYRRFKDCIPLGLYKIWFRVKEGSLEGLGDLLGYSDLDFNEMITYSPLSKRNGDLELDSWQQKLHIEVTVRECAIGTSKFRTVRFGNSISVGESPEALIPPNNTVSDGIWQNKTYKDREFMDRFILDYREKKYNNHHIRNCSRLPPNIVRLIECRKYQSRTEPEEEGEDAIGDQRDYLSIDRNSQIDVAPHLTTFNNSFTEFEKEEIFIEELRKHPEFHITVASPKNYKLNHWFHFPAAGKKSDPEAEDNLSIGPKQLRRYKWKVSQDMIEQLCEVVGGTIQRGHHILLDQLLEMNKEWTKDILRSNGISAIHKLSPEETLALQSEANLTTRQRFTINRFLRYFNGNKSVFANEKEISKSCSLFVCKEAEQHFATLKYYVDKDGKNYLEFNEDEAINRVKKHLKYFYCDPFEVLKCRLDYFRDVSGFKNFVSIGMVLDNDQSKQLPLYIFITILGDHGGSEMKVVQLNTLRNGDGQKYSTCIGQFEAKESHFIFANTIYPPINDSIEQNLNYSMLLVVEWGAQNPGPNEEDLAFDYLFYPKHLFLETDNYYELPSLLSWATTERGIEGVIFDQSEMISFNFSDIPVNCRVRNINIVVFSSGDISYQMEVLNRGHFGTCRCMKCKLKIREWQDQSVDGELYTNADFERIGAELQLSVEELRDMMVDEVEGNQIEELHNTLLGEAQEEAHRGGFAEGGFLLLPAIEVKDNFKFPVLHVKLGLTLTLYNRIFLFIFENLEEETEEVRNLRLNLIPAARIDYQSKCDTLLQCENSNIPAMEKVRSELSKHFKIKVEYEEKFVQENNRVPTHNQEAKYQTACQKLEELEPQWNQFGYFINHDSINIIAKARYNAFIDEKDNAKAREKESKKHLTDTIKRLQIARKNQWHKPVKKLTEYIMTSYGIVTQAYHSHSLIGEHCHRLLLNRKEILSDIEKIWVKEANKRLVDLDFDIITKIEKFICEMSELLEALDYCCSVLGRQNYWFNDEEINEFKSVAIYFGHIWREYLKQSVPPKLHMLEKHASGDLFKWRNTGNFGEDPVERDHHIENKFNQLFCNINDWEERKRLIKNRKTIYDSTKIASISNLVEEATSRPKRKINNTDEDAKRQKKASDRIEFIKKVIIKTPNNSSTSSQATLLLDMGDGVNEDSAC
jgi:hypothetical protein